MRMLAVVVVVIGAAWSASPGAEEQAKDTADLKVEVSGFSSRRGQLRLAVFRSAEGWPRDPKKVFRTAVLSITLPATTAVFEDLLPGTYAVSAYHDENGNGELDRSFLGIPLEDYGFSNDARATFGPPDFEEASFFLPVSGKTIRFRVE